MAETRQLPILYITEQKNPKGYARGVMVEIDGKQVEAVFHSVFSLAMLETFWTERDMFIKGLVGVTILDPNNRFVVVEWITDNPDYIRPPETRLDMNDVRKVFEQINSMG